MEQKQNLMTGNLWEMFIPGSLQPLLRKILRLTEMRGLYYVWIQTRNVKWTILYLCLLYILVYIKIKLPK